MIAGNFLRPEHKGMWNIAATPEDVVYTLCNDKGWIEDPRRIARI